MLGVSLAGCGDSSSSDDESSAAPRVETERNFDVAAGHAEASIPTDTEPPISEGEALWQSLGASPELARCYAELFEREGITVTDASEVAAAQADFSDQTTEAFAACSEDQQ